MRKLIPNYVWLVAGVMDRGAPAWRGLYWHYHTNKREALRELRTNRREWPGEPHELARYQIAGELKERER